MNENSKKLILIIEDDQILSKGMATGLLDAGYEVHTAKDGEEGLAQIEVRIPDLILLDIMMPNLNGIEVARRLKSKSETKEIPIIILTVRDKPSSIAEALEVGVTDYVVKSDLTVENIVEMVGKKLMGKK